MLWLNAKNYAISMAAGIYILCIHDLDSDMLIFILYVNLDFYECEF